MAKQKSRPARWAEAVSKASMAFEAVRGASDDLVEALTDLNDILGEYEDWRDNLPENLQQSALAEKLNEVCELDTESVMDDPLNNWSDVEDLIGTAEGIELPRGFGRD